MAQGPTAVDDEGSRSTAADPYLATRGTRLVPILRRDELAERAGVYFPQCETAVADPSQKEYDLNYDDLDQRHGPALATTSL
jgi:hypothetical protein